MMERLSGDATIDQAAINRIWAWYRVVYFDTPPGEAGRFLVPPAGATDRLAATCRSPAVPKRYVPVCPTVPLPTRLCRTGSQIPCWIAWASPASRISRAAL